MSRGGAVYLIQSAVHVDKHAPSHDAVPATSNSALSKIHAPPTSALFQLLACSQRWQTPKRNSRASQTPIKGCKQVCPPLPLAYALPLTSHLDLQTVISARQKLESQQQENKGVQKVSHSSLPSTTFPYTPSQSPSLHPITKPHPQEFSLLPTSSQIYKLVGPVLLKQERSEAVMAVEGRLEFIEREMYVYPPLALTHTGEVHIVEMGRKG